MDAKRKAQRRKKDAKPAERIMLGLRVTPELKRRLDDAAKHSGRSQSQEAEFRLERAFDRDDLLSEAMSLAFGRELAGVLIAVGTAMGWARPNVRRNPPEKWVNNPVEFDQAVRAANHILEALRPPGDPSPQREHNNWHGPIASEMLLAITRGDSKAHFFGMESELVRSLLGPEIVKRIKVEEPKP
jgi:hypothetical protein